MTENQIKKEKKWLFFAIGLIVGFLISAVAFVVFAMIQSQSRSFTKTIEHIYSRENTRDTVVKYVNVVSKESEPTKTNQVPELQDTVMFEEDPLDYDEVDFSYTEKEENVNDDVVVVDKLLTQRKVKVQCKDADFKDVASDEGVNDFFEVQQWSTPIKNRVTYCFSGNLLQIKGVPADKVEIIYYDQQYYLYYAGNYYRLRSNDSFEKLGAPLVLNPQK